MRRKVSNLDFGLVWGIVKKMRLRKGDGSLASETPEGGA